MIYYSTFLDKVYKSTEQKNIILLRKKNPNHIGRIYWVFHSYFKTSLFPIQQTYPTYLYHIVIFQNLTFYYI